MNTQTDTGPDDHPLEDNTRPSLFICLLLVDEGACDEGAGPNDGGGSIVWPVVCNQKYPNRLLA